MACMCCGHEIPVKQAENGTINAACQWCDFPAYAKQGTEAHRIITGKLKNKPAPAPQTVQDPANKPTGAISEKPAPRRRNSIFDMG